MVSVIVPVYNAEAYVQKCLESIQNQSYRNIEIIIIDDGSTDSTHDICQKKALEDSRIILVKQENRGVSAARNHGLDIARGKFICFVDADDLLPNGAIDIMVTWLHEGYGLIIGSHSVFRTSKLRHIGIAARSWDATSIRHDFAEFDKLINTPWAKMYLSQIISKYHIRFDESLPLGEDHKFNLAYCQHISSVNVIADTVYHYRLGGMASSLKYYSNKAILNFSLLDSYRENFSTWDMIPVSFIKKKVRDQLYGCVEHYIIHCRIRDAIYNIESLFDVFSVYLTKELIDTEFYSRCEIDALLKRRSRKILFLVYIRKMFKLTAKRVRAYRMKRR